MSTLEVTAEINRFREKLLDLTNRNPLLNYRKSKRRTLQIVDELPDQIFTHLVINGKRFRFDWLETDLAPVTVGTSPNSLSQQVEANGDPKTHELPFFQSRDETDSERHLDDKLQTNLSEERLESVLKNIRREAATAIEETGVNYLFLVLGLLGWKESKDSDRELLAPLILIPIEIERYFDGRSNRYEYAAKWREEEIQDNLCLAKRLEKDFGMRLPSYEEEQLPEKYFEAVQTAVCLEPGWTVRREALLGFFSFQKLLMYIDIDPENWKGTGRMAADSVAGRVILGQDVEVNERLYASDYEIDMNPAARKITLATDADSSQHSALMDIAAGKNLVIEGPPGTGKSQTITNAIAAAISNGKSVLFVAEKLAALEVVFSKLKELGLADFCLELHSDAASPRHVFRSFRERLDAIYQQPQQLEALQEELDRKKQIIAEYLEACSRRVGPYREPLYEILWRIVDQRALGQSAHRSANCEVNLSRAAFEENAQLLEAFAESMLEAEAPKKSPWWGYWPNRLNPNDCRPVTEPIERLSKLVNETRSTAQQLDTTFGSMTAEWVDGHIGDKSLVSSVLNLARNAVALARPYDMPRFLNAEAIKDVENLCSLLAESRPLEPEAVSYLASTLDVGAKTAGELQQLITQEILPRIPEAKWGELLRINPHLDDLLQVLHTVLCPVQGTPKGAAGNKKSVPASGIADFLPLLERLGALANSILGLTTDFDAAFGDKAAEWLWRSGCDESLTPIVRDLVREAGSLPRSHDIKCFLNVETCKQAKRLSDMLIEFRGLQPDTTAQLATDLQTASLSAKALHPLIEQHLLPFAPNAIWGDLVRVMPRLGALLQLLRTMPVGTLKSSQRDLIAVKTPDRRDADFLARVHRLGIVAEEILATNEEFNRTLGVTTSEWVDQHIGEDTLLPAAEALASDAALLKRHDDIKRFLNVEVRKQAKQLCEYLEEFRRLEPIAKSQLLTNLSEGANSARELHNLVVRELALVAPVATWRDLNRLKSRLGSLLDVLRSSHDVTQQMRAQGLGSIRTLREFERAEYLCKLLRHHIVSERSEIPAPLFFRSASATLQRGQSTAEELIDCRERLDKHFHIASVPEGVEVRDLAKTLRIHANSWWRLFSTEYRAAKRQLAGFGRASVGTTLNQWIEKLEELGDWLSACSVFRTNDDYCKAFGDLFCGIETDWERCKMLLQWAVIAQSRGLDQVGACKLLQHRNTDLLTAQPVVRARKLIMSEISENDTLAKLGLSQCDPVDVSLAAIEERATFLRGRIDTAEHLANIFSLRDNELLDEVKRRCEQVQRAAELEVIVRDSSTWTSLGAWYAGHETDVEALSAVSIWAERLAAFGIPVAAEEAICNGDVVQRCNKVAQLIGKATKQNEEWNRYGAFHQELERWITQSRAALHEAIEAAAAFSLFGDEPFGEISRRCKQVQRAAELVTCVQDENNWAALGDWYESLKTDATSLAAASHWTAQLAALKLPVATENSLLSGEIASNFDRFSHLIDNAKQLRSDWRRDQQSHSVVERWVANIRAPLANAIRVAANFSLTGDESLQEVARRCQRVQHCGDLIDQVRDGSKWKSLGDWYTADTTNDEALADAALWAQELSGLKLPTTVEQSLLSGEITHNCETFAALLEKSEQLKSGWFTELRLLAQIGKMEETWLPWSLTGDVQAHSGQAVELLLNRINELPAWSSLCRSMDSCQTQGLADFTDAVLDGQVEPAMLANCYRFTILERIAESTLWSSSPLKTFSRKAIEKARARFQELDRELLKVNRVLVAHRASQCSAPLGNSRGRVGEFTEMGLIRHEIQKQKRNCRIRDLLRRAGTAAQALKPCFMMSPLSVAQFLAPESVEFDLVVMDEASQVKPEDAIGTLLRAKQLVVVGDPKQLPPTSFFDRMEDDVSDEEATQFDNTESVLEVAMKSFQPVRRLRWHYRSQHESLIHFSNNRFYDGDLVVFPSAHGAADNLGLRHHFVEGGKFENGCNPIEAEQVARAIIAHAQNFPNETLGVGTFNLKQSILIEDWLDRLCESDASARRAVEPLQSHASEELFINNLETLQGHERDVILISYTYGPDPASGRVMNRFGPVTGAAGWRRINVLVTRARRRVEVYASMHASDIQGGPDKSLGVNAYKDYLEYCRSGVLSDRGMSSGREMESPFEEAVARVIARMGLEVVPQVGVAGYFIDLGVRKPGEADYLLGIECDGATYHSSRSARDRDRLREEVIRSRGWELYRIWSTDWYLNQKHEEERLLQELQTRFSTCSSPHLAN